MTTNYENSTSDDYLVGPTNELRVKLHLSFLSILLCFGIVSNGIMLILFARFRSLRTMANFLLADLTVVEFLDVTINIPIFMEFFLLTKKRNLDRQTRWYAMFFHRFFLINDLFSQLALSVDCLLAIFFGKQFTSRKTWQKMFSFVFMKWFTILALLISFSVSSYRYDDEVVSDEAYQRLLFGPSQIIWKTVIPSCQLASVVTILLTNFLISKSRRDVSNRYGMKVHGRGSKNSNKAMNTLFIIMVVQTLCKIPASFYSYIAVDDRVEGNRWFAFFAYFCLFLSSSVMPVIYFFRTEVLRRSILQIRKHPFAKSAYLDYAAHHGYTQHRNGREFHNHKIKRKKNKRNLSNEIKEMQVVEDIEFRDSPFDATSTCKTVDTPLTCTSLSVHSTKSTDDEGGPSEEKEKEKSKGSEESCDEIEEETTRSESLVKDKLYDSNNDDDGNDGNVDGDNYDGGGGDDGVGRPNNGVGSGLGGRVSNGDDGGGGGGSDSNVCSDVDGRRNYGGNSGVGGDDGGSGGSNVFGDVDNYGVRKLNVGGDNGVVGGNNDNGGNGGDDSCAAAKSSVGDDDDEQYCVTRFKVDVQMHSSKGKDLAVPFDYGQTTSNSFSDDNPGNKMSISSVGRPSDNDRPDKVHRDNLFGDLKNLPGNLNFEVNHNDVYLEIRSWDMEFLDVLAQDCGPVDESTLETAEGFDTRF